jgi:molybdenum cofactor biosynthesis enzyme MoaA
MCQRKIEGKYELAGNKYTTAGPARCVSLGDESSRIGFISPVMHNFCADCNREQGAAVFGKQAFCGFAENLRDPDKGLGNLKLALVKSMG